MTKKDELSKNESGESWTRQSQAKKYRWFFSTILFCFVHFCATISTNITAFPVTAFARWEACNRDWQEDLQTNFKMIKANKNNKDVRRFGDSAKKIKQQNSL